MSKGNQQALTMINLTASCFGFLASKKVIDNEEFNDLSMASMLEIKEVIIQWPKDSQGVDWEGSFKAVREMQELSHEDGSGIPPTVLVCMMDRIVEDLKFKLSNEKKVKLVNRVDYLVKYAMSILDPDGNDFEAFQKAGELLDILYERIGWRW